MLDFDLDSAVAGLDTSLLIGQSLLQQSSFPLKCLGV